MKDKVACAAAKMGHGSATGTQKQNLVDYVSLDRSARILKHTNKIGITFLCHSTPKKCLEMSIASFPVP